MTADMSAELTEAMLDEIERSARDETMLKVIANARKWIEAQEAIKHAGFALRDGYFVSAPPAPQELPDVAAEHVHSPHKILDEIKEKLPYPWNVLGDPRIGIGPDGPILPAAPSSRPAEHVVNPIVRLIEKLNAVAKHDWRLGILAHTSDTAKEAADLITQLQAEVARVREELKAAELATIIKFKIERDAAIAESDRWKDVALHQPYADLVAARARIEKLEEELRAISVEDNFIASQNEEKYGSKSDHAYQVIGSLLSASDAFETDEGQRALDYFSSDKYDKDFLPWLLPVCLVDPPPPPPQEHAEVERMHRIIQKRTRSKTMSNNTLPDAAKNAEAQRYAIKNDSAIAINQLQDVVERLLNELKLANDSELLAMRNNEPLRARIAKLEEGLRGFLKVIDAAGLHNLTRGVQLGQTVWYVKANDACEFARALLSPNEPGEAEG